MRAFRIFIKGVLALVGLLVSFALAVAIWPQILINSFTLSIAQRIAAQRGIFVSWNSFELQIDSLSLFRKRFFLNSENLCVRIPKEPLKACGSQIDLSWNMNFSGWIPRVTDLGPVDLKSLSWETGKGEEAWGGKLHLQGETSSRSELSAMDQWNFQLWGDTHLPGKVPSNLQAHVYFNLSGPLGQKTQAHYLMRGRYTRENSVITAEAFGSATGEKIQGSLTGRAKRLSESFPEIRVKDCEIEFLNSLKKGKSDRWSLDCPVQLRLPVPPQSVHAFQIPTFIGLDLKANFDSSSFLPTGKSQVTGPVSVDLDPIMTPLFEGKGSASGQLSGVLFDFSPELLQRAEAEFNASVPIFERLVSQLDTTPWAIPAPFHVLRGRGEIASHAEVVFGDGRVEARLETQMKSKNQKMDIDGKGIALLDTSGKDAQPKFELDFQLNDVQLELPRLELAKPPRLLSDERIVIPKEYVRSKKTPQKSKSPKYRISVHTSPERPVRVLSNLAKAPIPVHLNLLLTDSKPITGDVRFGKFPVELFRRQALVDHFILHLDSPASKSEIQGLAQMKFTDYTLFLEVGSTLSRPQLQLISEPPLPEEQLFSVLLFGQSIEELDQDQASSVGNTRAAIADGAINLASLYLLAFTPIESVGYDPSTGAINAKVRLAEGTSLNFETGVGGSAQATTLGIRKRLGGHWTITTDISDTIDSRSVASAYLQWSRRY